MWFEESTKSGTVNTAAWQFEKDLYLTAATMIPAAEFLTEMVKLIIEARRETKLYPM